jgi:hypothetical protein
MTLNNGPADRDQNDTDRLVKEFLANGGSITHYEKYARTPADEIKTTYGWGKKKKKPVDSAAK